MVRGGTEAIKVHWEDSNFREFQAVAFVHGMPEEEAMAQESATLTLGWQIV